MNENKKDDGDKPTFGSDSGLAASSVAIEMWSRELFKEAQTNNHFRDLINRPTLMVDELLSHFPEDQIEVLWQILKNHENLSTYVRELVKAYRKLAEMDTSIKLFHEMRKEAGSGDEAGESTSTVIVESSGGIIGSKGQP